MKTLIDRILIPICLPAVLVAGALSLAACGGDDNYYPVPVTCVGNACSQAPVQFNLTVTGLASGTSLLLGDTGVDEYSVSANGTYSFQTYLSYSDAMIGALLQPAGQNCAIFNGTPDANGNVAVTASCTALASPAPAALAIYAGSLPPGAADGTGMAASFNSPSALATDAAGNVYVCDSNNNTIRKIAPGGVVTTLAGAAGIVGYNDGTGAAALFNSPQAIATDSAGNVYVADTGNDTIRFITPAGVVTTIAGSPGVIGFANGTGAAANFYNPSGIVVSPSSGAIYVADSGNNTIRLITSGNVVATLAGTAGVVGSADGSGAAAQFNFPQGMALDASGNIYVADTGNQTIREVTPGGVVTTFAGTAGAIGAADGNTTAATFNYPLDVVLDAAGNVYVADNGNSAIREISGGVVSTYIGQPGQSVFSAGTLPASLQSPSSLAISGTTLYLTDINAIADAPLP